MKKKLDQRLKSILDGIEFPIHIITKDKKIVYVNSTWEKYNYMKKEEVLGKTLSTVLKASNKLQYFFAEDLQADGQFIHFPQERHESPAMEVLRTGKPAAMMSYNRAGDTVLVKSVPIIFPDSDELQYVLTMVYNFTLLSNQNEKISNQIRQSTLIHTELKEYQKEMGGTRLMGNTPGVQLLRQQIESVAQTDVTVLLTGESGTGKEVIANEIYHRSSRVQGPFVKVNCSAIPENLIESELFGYCKGAFTGAVQDKPGFFQQADGGTILLDEIGEFPLHLQAKLLRVLQEKEVHPLGSKKTIPVNVRIIAATNRDLLSMVEAGEFRQDLYYRLNVMPIKIPALRERKDSLPNLCEHFLHMFNIKYNRNKKLSEKAMDCMLQYNWPGNIRELENLIERLVIIGNEQEISGEKVQQFLGERNVPMESEKGYNLETALEQTERQYLEAALKQFKTSYGAARALGISQASVVRKAHKYGIAWK